MKLVSSPDCDDLQTKIKNRFAEFNRCSSPARGRRYPKQLQDLVRRAFVDGINPAVLRQITGVSTTAMNCWIKSIKLSPSTPVDKPIAPRRFEVVSDGAADSRAAVVVRLPSGVTIEFDNGAALSKDLLTVLAALRRSHAATC